MRRMEGKRTWKPYQIGKKKGGGEKEEEDDEKEEGK